MISLLRFTRRSLVNWKVYRASLLMALLPSAMVHAQNAGYNNTYQQYYQQQSGYYDYNNTGSNNPNYNTPYKYNNTGGKEPFSPNLLAEKRNVRASEGKMLGLHAIPDSLGLKSSIALVIDQDANRVLYEKNTHAVSPIASITKLMTSLVVLDAKLPMEEILTITDEDVDYQKHTSSRLRVGQHLTRQEMLLLALMSSENRAASALGRYYPGGKPAFIVAMNRKAKELGMRDTRYVDSNGLSSQNVSSAYDLGRLVYAASQYPTIRNFSTNQSYDIVNISGGVLHYKNTNRLVRSGTWQIDLQKTGYISEAGKCLVMNAKVLGRSVIMVLLDSVANAARFNDALRIKQWLEGTTSISQSSDDGIKHRKG
jgi:D-alanyl-D-alanine endopeptidase (penicillin-binding protein 7)